jgi:hypothetical protein
MTTLAAIAVDPVTKALRIARHASPGDAIMELTHRWELPGLVITVTEHGEVLPLRRVNAQGIVYGFDQYPVRDADGSVYCPQCHARPGQQEPVYVGGQATGEFCCRSCGTYYQPAPPA